MRRTTLSVVVAAVLALSTGTSHARAQGYYVPAPAPVAVQSWPGYTGYATVYPRAGATAWTTPRAYAPPGYVYGSRYVVPTPRTYVAAPAPWSYAPPATHTHVTPSTYRAFPTGRNVYLAKPWLPNN